MQYQQNYYNQQQPYQQQYSQQPQYGQQPQYSQQPQYGQPQPNPQYNYSQNDIPEFQLISRGRGIDYSCC